MATGNFSGASDLLADRDRKMGVANPKRVGNENKTAENPNSGKPIEP